MRSRPRAKRTRRHPSRADAGEGLWRFRERGAGAELGIDLDGRRDRGASKGGLAPNDSWSGRGFPLPAFARTSFAGMTVVLTDDRRVHVGGQYVASGSGVVLRG